MQTLPPSLASMGQYAQFIPFALVPEPGKKDRKVPLDYRTGRPGDPHDPGAWQTFEAVAALTDKIGFVFTADDPFFFFDLDGCVDINGQWSQLATDCLDMFPGAAMEVSLSGKGAHVFGVGDCPAHSCKNIPLNIELYTEGRFCALTGLSAQGDSGTDHSAALGSLVSQYFTPKAGGSLDAAGTDWTDGPTLEWSGPRDNATLIEKACKSMSAGAAFGDKASFKELFEADTTALSAAYPDHHGDREFDGSSADAALAQHLAFWTGKDCERIHTIMNASALRRDKWDREDYMRRTILNACHAQGDVIGQARKPIEILPPADSLRSTVPEHVEPMGVMPRGLVITPPPAPAPSGPIDEAAAETAARHLGVKETKARVGTQFMGGMSQPEYFRGCVYVSGSHRILIPSGALLKPEQFKAMYGGYIFAIDSQNTLTSRNAWEAFMDSHCVDFPKVAHSAFLPLEEPGAVIPREGDLAVNTYYPCPVERKQGDAGRFHRHVEKLLPDTRDREIFMSYMAACVQYKGVKFAWAPILQGVQGNGKTFLTKAVAYCIGKKYTHFPRPMDLMNNFNSWIAGKIFIGVEDIYMPGSRDDIMEILKPMITGEDAPVELKGVDASMVDICANFIFNSNHRDALKYNDRERRFAVFFTAQQSVGDLLRDGMDSKYMSELYSWFFADGAAIIAEELNNYKIPDEFNPTIGARRAPRTTSTDAANAASLGRVEQEIVEASQSGRTGFCGGWVSSTHLSILLNDLRVKMAPQKRADMLGELGYIPHPGLTNGRSNSAIALDNATKSRLFVKGGANITHELTGSQVVKAYIAAQSHSPDDVAAAFEAGAV